MADGKSTRWNAWSITIAVLGILIAIFGVLFPLALWFFKSVFLVLMKEGIIK